MKKVLILLIGIAQVVFLSAQTPNQLKSEVLEQFKYVNDLNEDVLVEDYFDQFKSSMLLGDNDEMILINNSDADQGWAHYRFQQYHQGIPVEGVSYQLHTRKDRVVSANGSFLPAIELSIKPSLSEASALEKAMSVHGAEKYSWQSDHEHNGFCTHGSPEPSLCIIDRKYPDHSGDYALCYQLDLVSLVPLSGWTYYIDAHTGEVITKITLHQHQGVPGKGVTKNHGVQDIIVDSIAPTEFVLHDPTRGNDGISIWGGTDFKTYTSESNYFDLTNEDQDEIAVDALYLTSNFYDLCRDELDWLGIDNMNGSMNVNIHSGDGDLVNAFWNREFASFGDGDCNNDPLVTMDVLAHEFMHGITQYTSGLIYASESGAINESLSDVIGKYFEWYLAPDRFSWELGPSFQLNENDPPFRHMADPESVGNPSYYRGETWEDFSGVHTNSAIGNLFYVLLTDGGSGINENMEQYTVTSIGHDAAAKFIFHVNRNYLSENSNYNEYFEACMLAAPEFFQGDQAMIDNVEQAWKAVGLPYEVTTSELNLDLSISGGELIRACGYGDFHPVSFVVENVGNLSYRPSMAAEVQVGYGDFGFPTETILLPIDTIIAPGDRYMMTVDSFVIVQEDFVVISYEVLFDEDENFENNMSNGFVLVNEHEYDDLEFRGSIEDMSCYDDSIALEFLVGNASCFSYPGNEIRLILEDNSGVAVWSQEYELESIESNQTVTINLVEEIDIKDYRTLNMRIEVENDPNEDNNVAEAEVRVLDWVDSDFSYGFEGQINPKDILVNNSNFDPYYDYNGSRQMFATGLFAESFSSLCADGIGDWKKEVGDFSGHISASIDLCPDLTGVEEQVLVFDLTQFKNDFQDVVAIESSSLRVNWDSPQGSGFEVIKGLTEGVTEEINIPLPDQFAGTINLQFLTQTGTFMFDSEFLEYDVQFIDNIEFLPRSVSVDEPEESTFVRLHPNPANDVIHIHTPEIINGITIFDASGQNVMRQSSSEIRDVSLADLTPGFYIMRLETQDKEIIERKFIKAE